MDLFKYVPGIGLGITGVPAFGVTQYYFIRRRPLASGISLAGQSFGIAIIVPVLQKLIEKYGWKGTTLLQSGFTMHIFISGCLYLPTVKPKALQKQRNSKTPELINKPAVWERIYKIACINNMGTMKTCSIVVFLLCGMLCLFQQEAMYKMSPLKALSVGLSPEQAAWCPSVVGIGSLCARLVTSVIANLPGVDCNIILALALVIGGFTAAGFIFADSFPGLAVIMAVYGISSGH